MQHFSRELLYQARRTDLYEYLLTYHMDQFCREGHSIHPINNRSVSIKQGYNGYIDFSTGESGNSVDYLVRHLGYQLDEAVFSLCRNGNPTDAFYSPDIMSVSPFGCAHSALNIKECSDKLEPQFPEAFNGPYKQLYAYLMWRGVSSDTIAMLVDEKILYQDTRSNIIFANKERDWGERRGTNTYMEERCLHRSGCKNFVKLDYDRCKSMGTCSSYKKSAFRGMIANSRSDGFWWFQVGAGKSDKVYVCEAAIDAISLYELHKKMSEIENAVYVSIGGTAKQPAINRLKSHKRVILAVDNDSAGSECRKRNADLECIIPKHKDWNEDLLAEKKP